MTKAAWGIVFTVVLALGAQAQAVAGRALNVDYSVPFGTVPGKLLLLGEHLVFVDEMQPEGSFVLPRENIESLNAEGMTITVQSRAAVRDRSGDRTRLSFRMGVGADPALVTSWYSTGAVPAGAPPAAIPAATLTTPAAATSYEARHNHRIGECRGRLVITADMISYESVDAVEHSRRWQMSDIREISHPNPYELRIDPFGEGRYRIRLDGQGMDPQDYKALVDRVTAARGRR